MASNLLTRRNLLRTAGVAGTALIVPIGLTDPAHAKTASGTRIVVADGETLTVEETTTCSYLKIADGATLAAPDGSILTITVNGVETGSALVSTYGVTTTIEAGTYRGEVVIAVTTVNEQTFAGYTFDVRQAVYVDADGINEDYSVLSAVIGTLGAAKARNITLRSTGEAFDGFWVTDGTYELINPMVRYHGNGRLDFAGYGASLVGTGSGTRFVIDGASIVNHGAVRPGVIANDGANVIVKNSRIATHDGTLPSDYSFGLGPTMMSVPWMLGLSGNVRATVALGSATKATYVNSHVSSTNWGVLSTDSDNEAELTAINCVLAITDTEGYGTYADGSAIDKFYGCKFRNVAYAGITTGGSIYFGNSTADAVAAVNTSQDLQLTRKERAALAETNTVIDSTRFGVMFCQGSGGSVTIDGATRFTTAETMFLVKAVAATISVDGSDGAKLTTDNGVLLQLMETDDPGSGTGTYTEPTDEITKDDDFDTETATSSDVIAEFTSIKLAGDFYNGRRDDQNMALTFTDSTVKGVISASVTAHSVSSISSTEYQQLGRVSNTTSAAVNNGVIVSLVSSTWKPTDVSYLTSLTLDEDSKVKGATMTVDGTATTIEAGTTYTGAIVVTPS
ncbi:MAG: hypothetical protein QM638_20445 [Nocardioides sp.]|uniref:hypothetical protein n=1 Tax=Nocardioides sp. TaxID=35761 RepID=UPI0039E36019